jgi:hypothetical protein
MSYWIYLIIEKVIRWLSLIIEINLRQNIAIRIIIIII